jgi:cell wall-associated NlpC family hydrolase
LPRTSASQATVGTAVRRSDLKVGDLVFFRTTRSSRISHVGIYIGNNRFIHASSGRSMRVRTNSLGESYYNSRFAGARRLPGLTKKVTDDIESLPVSPEGDEPPVQTGG